MHTKKRVLLIAASHNSEGTRRGEMLYLEIFRKPSMGPELKTACHIVIYCVRVMIWLGNYLF